MILSIIDNDGERRARVDECAKVTLEIEKKTKIGTIVIGDILRTAIPKKGLTNHGSSFGEMLQLKATAYSVGVLTPKGSLIVNMTDNPFYLVPNKDGGIDIFG